MDFDVNVIWLFLAAVIGSFAGSVIHAISLRLPARLEPLGRVTCVECQQPLPLRAFVPFIPVHCPECGTRVNWHKPATEFGSAAIVALSLVSHGLNLNGITYALLSLILLLILRIDWQHHLIYTVVIVPGVVVAFAFAAFDSQSQLISAAIAAFGAGLLFAAFFGLAILIYRKHALGMGDILLAFLIGAMARLELVAGALLLGMLLAALGGLFLIAIGKRTRYDYIPYGAYLCLGAMIVLLLPT
jgi:leader peptidase (prepilin peptidase) / N-methyltransferase